MGKSKKGIEKSDSVLNFLESRGFDRAQIGALIVKNPSLLHARVESTLKPKLQFLRESGLSGTVSYHLIVNNPVLFRIGVDSWLKPRMSFLKKYLPSADALNNAIRRSGWLLTKNSKRFLEPNIVLLMSKGVTADSVSQMMTKQPRSLMVPIVRMSSIVEALGVLGIQSTAANFWVAASVMSGMKASTLQRKV